jgi:type IV fimbrial biogenesis protein FimT
MNKRQQHGFTLWELLMTLLVAGIIFGVGIPNVMEFQRNGLMTGAANDVITAMLTARTEAVKRQAPATWCFTDDAQVALPRCLPGTVQDSVQGAFTVNGFVVWVDENGNGVLTDVTDGNAVVDAGETVLTRGAAPGGSIRVSAGCGHVTYGPNGFRLQVGALCPNQLARNILFCDDRGRRVASGGLSSARIVQIDRLGRAQVLVEKAVVDPVITAVLPHPLIGVTPTCP